MSKQLLAEFVGTFWLVLAGCGSIILAATYPGGGNIGTLGAALAFGFAVLTLAYALGPISGAHFNPALTIGMAAAGRFPGSQILPYIIAQLIGAIVGTLVLSLIAAGSPNFALATGFAANGYGLNSPGGFGLGAAFLCELLLTAFFVMVTICSFSWRALEGYAPITMGLAFALAYLVSIPVTGGSINPARSTGPALIVGGWALSQLWCFWIAPIAGALIGGVLAGYLSHDVEVASPSLGELAGRREEREGGGGPKVANY